MFENLKKSLGISKNPPSRGHVLGSKDSNSHSSDVKEVISLGEAEDNVTYDLTFTDDKLGMSVEMYELQLNSIAGIGSRPVVTNTTPNSQAAKFGEN